MDSRTDLVKALKDLLGADAVIDQAADMQGFTEDWRGRYRGAALCIVQPSSAEQVASVVRLCAAHDVPILPQGGNTSLCGGAVPRDRDPAPVVINLARMRRIRHIDVDNRSMEVEAGCVLKIVQDAAAEKNCFYPVSLGAEGSCQIGGTLSTNAGGTNVLRYGNTRDNVLGLEVVLADGSIWRGLKGLRKDNTGIDLKQMFIGTEGTLGIITAATLKLHPLPDSHALAWFAPVDPAAALTILGMFREACGSRLSAYELMNALQLELVVRHVDGRRSPFADSHRWHVLVELSDTGAGEALQQVLQDTLQDAIEAGLVEDAVIATSDAQRNELWELRHSVSEANKKAGVGLTTDCAVPVSAVPAFIEGATRAVRSVVADIGMEIDVVIVGHVGDGNVHFIPMLAFEAWDALTDAPSMAARIRRSVDDVACSLGGTFSAEHGIGQTGLPEMKHYKSEVELRMMYAVKQALDPRGLLNPGRLLP